MIIAVVGSDGYIGKTLCDFFETRRKYTVLRFDAQVYGQSLHFATVKTKLSEKIVEALKLCKPDAIVWLAAYAHDPEGKIPQQLVQENNCIQPAIVARWAADHNIPFIAVSSLSVFSHLGAYPASKRCLEHALLGTPNSCRFVDIVRFGTLYGTDGEAGHLDVFRSHLLLNSMVFGALAEKKIKISYPALRRPVTSLWQAVYALAKLVEYEGPRGRIENTYQTCGTLAQYAESVRGLVYCPKEITIEHANAGFDIRDYGWGVFAGTKLWADLTQLISYTTRHLEKIRQYRDQFPKNLYTYLGLPTDGPK